MMKKTKISVIIPFFNVDSYIEETLNSVLQQDLEDIEVILVNDGSTDKSLEIIKSLVGSDEHFKIIEQENQGQCAARNAGLEIAKGEYVFFLDSDDLLSENYFANLYDIACKNNLDLLCTDTLFLKDGILKDKNFISKSVQKAFKAKNIYEEFFYIVRSSVVWGKLYKRAFLKENNILFKNFRRFEDNFFIFKVILNYPKIGYCFDSKIYYRIRENSIMTSIRPKSKDYYENLDILESIDLLIQNSNLTAIETQKFRFILDDLILSNILSWGKRYHDYEFIGKLLSKLSIINIIKNPFLNFSRKKKFFKFLLKKRIFYIDNSSEKHKIIMLFGFKIKIKFKEYTIKKYIEKSICDNENLLLNSNNLRIPAESHENNILIISDYFLEKGGIETRLKHYLSFLYNKGWGVYILSESNKNPELLKFKNFILHFNASNLTSNILELVKAYNITNIEFHFASSNYLNNIQFQKFKNVKFGSVIHNLGVKEFKIINKFDYNIVVSRLLYDKRIKKCYIIENAVENLPTVWKFCNQKKALLISRLDEEKLATIEAFIQYCNKHHILFDIAGKSSNKQIILSLIEKYGLSKETFIGNINTIEYLRQKVSDYLFVGGVGQVMLEAGVLGFPCFCASHLGVGFSSFITQNNLQFFIPNNFTIKSPMKAYSGFNLIKLEEYDIHEELVQRKNLQKFMETYFKILIKN